MALPVVAPAGAPTVTSVAGDVGPDRAAVVLGPNWFATVMGTGIVAVAAATLPHRSGALRAAAGGVWVLAALLLVLVTTATVLHHRRQGTGPGRYLGDRALVDFHGAVAMAPLTVGAGALLVGRPLIGTPAAVAVAASLWVVGTLLGLATVLLLPRQGLREGRYRLADAGGTWLMPVVPPMVSAATGPLLLPYLPAGAPRVAMLLVCLALFVLTLVPSVVVVGAVCRRLLRHGPGPTAALPTLFLVLGPLGQSVTAAHTIGDGAELAGADAGPAVGLAYGLPTWCLALAWLGLATALLVRAATRTGVPFSMTWWSFTFPVGTVVTGTSALAAATGSAVLADVAVTLYVLLVAAWLLVAGRTVAGLRDGSLLRPAVGPVGGPTGAPALLAR